jgi:hypothetical protein
MPLTAEQRALKKTIYNRIKVDEPIQPTDDRYVQIYRNPETDPIERLKEHIELTEVESMQFFSGFRGSGKTTELYRLKSKLEADGYFVIYANALDYINPADELDITDLLIVLAGAFSDALDEELGTDIKHESYWERIKQYLLNTNLEVSEATLKSEVSTPAKDVIGGLKAGVDLKLALSTTPSFRQNLQKLLTNRIGELKRGVDNFIQEGVKLIRKKKGDDARIVFIFDSLEQIRGSLFNEQVVIESVERTFSQNFKLLELQYVHAVYSVPPWLKFVMPNSFTKPIVILHSIKQWKNDEKRTHIEGGNDKFCQLILKRFGKDGFEQFFGEKIDKKNNKAEKLIAYCGGSLRDLMRLLNEVLLPAMNFPVSDDEIQRAIVNVKSSFLPVTIDDAHWLSKIAKTRTCALQNIKGENVGRLTRFLDTHFVLYFRNGDEWYDVNPLIREEVERIVKNNPLEK